MAGVFPDVPGNRFEIERDGTSGASITSAGVVTALTNTQLQNLNTEGDSFSSPAPGTNGFLALIFPELRDLLGAYVTSQSGANITLQTSVDTTTGFDGSWSTYVAAAVRPTSTGFNYRNLIAAASATGVKALRVQFTTGTTSLRTFHVYGKVSAATPDKLEFWHPTLDQPLYQTPASLDYGDVSRSDVIDKTFRLKNLSTTLTANTITLSTSALTDASSPTMLSGLTISYDGGAFGSTASIPSLAPGTISSGLIILRNSIPATVAPWLWSQRIIASAVSWS